MFHSSRELLDQILRANDIEYQMKVLFDRLLLKDSDLEKRNKFKDYLQEVLNLNGFECRLHFFGSTVDGLGFRDSDMDIFIETLDGKQQKSWDDVIDSHSTIHTILKERQKLFRPILFQILRWPYIKLVLNEVMFANHTDIKVLGCELSMNNPLSQRNSCLIRHFCHLEPRFQQLCLLLHFWAKINGFIGSRSKPRQPPTRRISSYAFTQLVLFFCQSEGLLPSVDRLRQLSDVKPLMIDGLDCSFSENIESFGDNHRNSDSFLQLLGKFFAFYANFDFSHLIISTKTGLTKHKSEVLSQKFNTSDEEVVIFPELKFKFELTPILSIEDPFNLTDNLCEKLHYTTFDKFCEYSNHISRNFKQIFINNCNQKPTIYEPTISNVNPEEYPTISDENPSLAEGNEKNSTQHMWGLSPLCRKWDPTPTGYPFPHTYIGYAHLDLILSSNSSQSPNDLMQLMANRLIDLTDIWLSKVYRIESLLLSKSDPICGQLTPFAEFYIKVRALDSRTIDSKTREKFRKKFSEEDLKKLSLTELETEITDRIHRHFHCDLSNSDVVPINCHFALVMNCRPTFPTIELSLIDFIDCKPCFKSRKSLLIFLRKMIATAAEDSRILDCPYW